MENRQIEMINKYGEKQILIFRKMVKEDAVKIFNSKNNPYNCIYNGIPRFIVKQKEGYKTAIEILEEIACDDIPNHNGQYFYVVEIKKSKELIGWCRFGPCKGWVERYSDRDDVWDFDYNIIRTDDKDNYSIEDIENAFNQNVLKLDKNWGCGYATEILKFILKFAKQNKISKVTGESHVLNFASCKVQIKNGLKFVGFNRDKYAEFEIDLLESDIGKTDLCLKNWDEYLKEANKFVYDNKIFFESERKELFELAVKRWEERQEL